MGYISSLVKATPKSNAQQSRAIWREVFGNQATDKEEGKKPIPGGSFGRSLATSDASYKRLLQAMRSMAPGGWSDDKFEQSRHYVGIAYVAIHRQNELFAQSEFQVFEKDEKHPDGKRPVANDHPLVKLLERPNPDDSWGDLMACWNLQQDLTGMALTWMVPNKLGQPFELYPIPTAIAIPQPCINPEYPDGYYRIQPVYPYGPFSSYPTPASAVGAAIPAQWMLRFKYPHPLLRYEGYSPLTALRLHLDEIESMDRSRWYSMKRSVNPSAVLNFENMDGAQPLPEAEIERIKEEFLSSQQGPENAGQLHVAAPGSKLEPWGANPVDMDYQAGWEQLVSFALGGFGVTKPAAGMVEDSSYSTLFATLKQLYWLTLNPKADRIASKLTRHLAPFFGDNLIVEIRCKRLDDHEVKLARLNSLKEAKAITKNEFRKEMEMPLTEEEWGDEIAGTEKPPEQPGMGGMPGQEGQVGGNPNQPQQNQSEEELGGLEGLLQGVGEDEEDEIESNRPSPGNLSTGALGPRKHLLNGHLQRRR